jgi:hypothetical protein
MALWSLNPSIYVSTFASNNCITISYKMKAFLPENLDLDEIVRSNPPCFNYHIDNFKYLCSLINEVPSNKKEVYEHDDFIILNSQKIQERIHNYKSYFDYLIHSSIIETDNRYIVGEKSKGYRFKTEYRVPLKVVDLTRKVLFKKSRKTTAYDFQMENKYEYLWKWFSPLLTIDINMSLDFIEKQYRSDIAQGNTNALRKFNSAFISIHKFASKEFRLSVDTTAGRLHTNLTSLKSELRNFIKYDGNELVSIDIKNSQPCFSGVLFNPKFYESKNTNPVECHLNIFKDKIAKKSQIATKSLLTHLFINSPLSSHMLVNNTQHTDIQSIESYLEFVQDGSLYEYLANKMSQMEGTEIIQDRKKLKAIIFTSLFTSNRFIGQEDAASKRLFKKVFPDVYKIFSMLKKNDKTLLSKILQRIEAKVVLDCIAKRISKEYPELPLFTIHDNIVVLRGYELYVAQVIKEEMMRKVGMRASLKFENWTSNNEIDSSLSVAA